MKFLGTLLLIAILLLPGTWRPAAASAHPHEFCLHNARTLSLCLWDAPIGIGVEGTARVRNARVVGGPLLGAWLHIGPVSLYPYIGSRRAGNLQDVTLPVIGAEYLSLTIESQHYHLEIGNTENALLLYRWSNCEPDCARARWVWRLRMDYPTARHITLSPGP